MDTRTPAEIEDSERRKAQVLRLRRRRWTFQEIGQALDPPVSRQRAHKIYADALAEIVRPELDELRKEYRETLDEALREAWQISERDHVLVSHGRVVRAGVPAIDEETGKAVIREGEGAPLLDDAPKISALGLVKSLVESLRKLDGVDAPVKSPFGGGFEVNVRIHGMDAEAMR
ncbi:hypothetical protein [Actinosynnema sp. NPDC023587]|uniref:hypothetical protein n=1 Tax=Actinosynnema sp. NPDC023587 TaxID=3154695 RepID=UPI00340865A8